MGVGHCEAELLALLEVNGESYRADLAERRPAKSLKPSALISLQCAEPRIAGIRAVPKCEVIVPLCLGRQACVLRGRRIGCAYRVYDNSVLHFPNPRARPIAKSPRAQWE